MATPADRRHPSTLTSGLRPLIRQRTDSPWRSSGPRSRHSLVAPQRSEGGSLARRAVVTRRRVTRPIRSINGQLLTINQPASAFTLRKVRERISAFTLPLLRKRVSAFTLIEILVVITIIIILAGMLFPAYRGVQNQAKKTQAKNDLTQIVTAVNAYYTEYGKYPLATQGSDTTFSTDNSDVINTLRAIAAGANASDALNPRKIVFLSPPSVKDDTNPRAGVNSTGIYYDPWGKDASKPEAGVYHIAIDGTYDNQVANPYGNNNGAGVDPIRQGVIAWSIGSDGVLGNAGKFTDSDDVISWQ
jgi:type II secretory pathway pseudopilin PulG